MKYTMYISFIFIFIALSPASALKPISSYSSNWNDCELVAKDVQREFGGEIVLLTPLKDNGAYEIGDYSGHWINAISIHNHVYYIDYENQVIRTSLESMLSHMKNVTGKDYSIYVGSIIHHY